jgi:hypothetical protein
MANWQLERLGELSGARYGVLRSSLVRSNSHAAKHRM